MFGFGPRSRQAAKSVTANSGNPEAQSQQVDHCLVQRRPPPAFLAIQGRGDVLRQIANGQMACIHAMHYTNAYSRSQGRSQDKRGTRKERLRPPSVRRRLLQRSMKERQGFPIDVQPNPQ